MLFNVYGEPAGQTATDNWSALRSVASDAHADGVRRDHARQPRHAVAPGPRLAQVRVPEDRRARDGGSGGRGARHRPLGMGGLDPVRRLGLERRRLDDAQPDVPHAGRVPDGWRWRRCRTCTSTTRSIRNATWGCRRRTRRTTQQSSPLTFADRLRGNLLVVHGTGDDNVHYQGTERLINALVAANKPFQMMAYPNRTHGISEGEGTTLHLFTLLTSYLTGTCRRGGGRAGPPAPTLLLTPLRTSLPRMALPPNQAATRLLDALLAEPGTRTLEELLRWLLEASSRLTGQEVPRTRRLGLLTEALQGHPRAEGCDQAGRALGAPIWRAAVGGNRVARASHADQGVTGTRGGSPGAAAGTCGRSPCHAVPPAVGRGGRGLGGESAGGALAPWRAMVAVPPAVMGDAARLLAFRAAGVGITRELLELDGVPTDWASPFLEFRPPWTPRWPPRRTGWQGGVGPCTE